MSDVLAIGPHPDDVELAAGGTLALLAGAGYTVTLLDLTRGERATRGTPEIRAREGDEAVRALGVAGRESLGLPDTGVSSHDSEQVARLVTALRRHRPRLILTLSEKDEHPDHIEGAALVRRAVYLSGLRGYPGAGGEPLRPKRVLFGMLRVPFVPDLVVDVSAVYGQKRGALDAFKSQLSRDAGDSRVTPLSEPEFRLRLEARDRHYGGMIGAEFGEPFAMEGPWGVREPRQLVPEEAG